MDWCKKYTQKASYIISLFLYEFITSNDSHRVHVSYLKKKADSSTQGRQKAIMC